MSDTQDTEVKFRGKSIEDLTREELIEALRQALAYIRELERR